MEKKGIGIFDSGVGGLTVLKKLAEKFPNEKFYYLGDTARVPYGTKSKDTVVKYALQNTKFLLSLDIKYLIIACNTASSYAVDEVRKEFDIPVLGVIEPGVKEVLKYAEKSVGVIGTAATISSGVYQKKIKDANEDLTVYAKSCPLFVPLAEEGLFDDEITYLTAKKYLDEFIGKIDTLLLGCTHYPLLKNTIKNVVGKNVKVIDSAESISNHINEYLQKKNSYRKGVGELRFFVTDSPEQFKKVGEKFLGKKIEDVQLVDLSQ